jgi:hypothetical protein
MRDVKDIPNMAINSTIIVTIISHAVAFEKLGLG